MEFSDLNWFDITVISIVLLSSIFSFLKGFIKTSFSLVTWGGAMLLTIYLYPMTNEYFSEHLNNTKIALAFATLGVFIISFIIFAIIDGLCVSWFDHYRLGVLDRSFGFALGAIRGFLLVILLFFSIQVVIKTLHLDHKDKLWFVEEYQEASMHQLLTYTLEYSFKFLPASFQAYLDSTIETAQDVADSMIAGERGGDIVLNAETRAIMKKVILALPEVQLKEIYTSYENQDSGLTDEHKIMIFKDIYFKYKDAVRHGQVVPDKMISASEAQLLEMLFSGKTIESDDGYSKKHINDLDRLINAVE